LTCLESISICISNLYLKTTYVEVDALARGNSITIALWILVIVAVATYLDLYKNVFLRLFAPLARYRIALFFCMLIDLLNQLFNKDVLV